jgi:flagellar biosynthetic protein FliQ
LGADEAVGLMRQMLWGSFFVAGPVLATAMLVGLLVSVFQVATQLQEMTLSYVPKLLAAALVLMALGPWMLNRVTEYAINTFKLIPALGG